MGVALTWCFVAASTASAAVDMSVVNKGPEARVTTGETVT
jgi:hypothetical protein